MGNQADSLTSDQADSVKEAVGDRLIELILGDMSEGRSSVDGQKWAKLSKDYAAKKGSKLADLFKEGDLYAALEYKIKDDGVEYGFWSQKGKADGHNKHHDDNPNLPLRRSIPTEDEDIRSGILKELKRIAQEQLQ